MVKKSIYDFFSNYSFMPMLMTLKQCINLFISHHLFVINDSLLSTHSVQNIQQLYSKGFLKSTNSINFIGWSLLSNQFESVHSVLSCNLAKKGPYVFWDWEVLGVFGIFCKSFNNLGKTLNSSMLLFIY